jgi:hypothetical protein
MCRQYRQQQQGDARQEQADAPRDVARRAVGDGRGDAHHAPRTLHRLRSRGTSFVT